MKKKYYKITGKGGVSCHGGTGKWVKGEWRTVEGKLVPCENGLHLCEPKDLVEWLNEEIWEAEGDEPEMIREEDKAVFRRARVTKKLNTWNERTARLFAVDCAERVLPLFEKRHPNDDRPRKAIQAARDYANGKITKEALAAAGAAAWDAAGDAARAAARAAWAAAGAAAWAAWDAAGDAARAAGDAARAAGDAARAAAGAAAWAAAGTPHGPQGPPHGRRMGRRRGRRTGRRRGRRMGRRMGRMGHRRGRRENVANRKAI